MEVLTKEVFQQLLQVKFSFEIHDAFEEVSLFPPVIVALQLKCAWKAYAGLLSLKEFKDWCDLCFKRFALYVVCSCDHPVVNI